MNELEALGGLALAGRTPVLHLILHKTSTSSTRRLFPNRRPSAAPAKPEALGGAPAVPNFLALPCPSSSRSIQQYKKELDALGGSALAGRGQMLHLILRICQAAEKSFCKLIDGGAGGAYEKLARHISAGRCPPAYRLLYGSSKLLLVSCVSGIWSRYTISPCARASFCLSL
jgi:hypothetical protein